MRKILLIVATFLLVVACSKDDVNEPKDGNQLEKNFPFLKIGNSWTYNFYEVDLDNGSIDSNTFTLSLNRKDTMSFGYDTTYTVYYVTDGLKEDIFFIAANDSTLIGGISFWKPRIEFPDYLKSYTVGQSWGYYPNPDDYVSKTVISINETVTVEAGTFHNCIKIKRIREDEDPNPSFIWLRNDIGVIKIENNNRTVELKSKNF